MLSYFDLTMKQLAELIHKDDPAWPLIQGWIRSSKCPVEVLPVSRANGDKALVALQVTTRSPLGAIVFETGGILIDHGWLRLLGSGSPQLPRSLPEWTSRMIGSEAGQVPPFLLVADDVVGGFFAIDGGGLGLRPGDIAYFAPDTMRWESLKMGHTQFVQWALSDNLDGFYTDYRWSGWQEEVRALTGGHAFSIYPPPVFKGEPFPRRSRRAIPIDQLYSYYQELARQLEDVPDGAQIDLSFQDGAERDPGENT